MGLDQLAAFKDLRYGISVLYGPMVRGNLLFGGVGDRNALLRSSCFFVIPLQLQAAAFGSCQRVVSIQLYTCLHRLQHPLVSQAVHPLTGARSGDSSWDSCPWAILQLEEEDGQWAPSLGTLEDRGCARLSCWGKTPSSPCGECPNVASQEQTLSNHKVPIFSCWHSSTLKVQICFGSTEGLASFEWEVEQEMLSCPSRTWISSLLRVTQRVYKGQSCTEIQGVDMSIYAVDRKLLLIPDLPFTPQWAVSCLSHLEDVLRGTWSTALPYQAWIWDR